MIKKIFYRIVAVLVSIMNFLPSAVVIGPTVSPYSLNVPIYKKIIEFFFPKEKETSLSSGKFVYVSGYPIGFSIDGDGAVVVEKSAVITPEGHKNPTENKNILIGDIIKEVNGVKVSGGESISRVINSEENIKKPARIKIDRNGEIIETTVTPEFDIYASSYRLGLWVRDNAIGVGTVTYVRDDGGFGALGHPITDIDTGKVMPVRGGSVYRTSIIGTVKGERGKPGELKGLFLKSASSVGEVKENNESGVYGVLDEKSRSSFMGERLEVALPDEVKMGEAEILSTVDGLSPKRYKIEIIKTKHITSDNEKCMVIRVVDENLKNITGGIVQGMSGSPIIQNGKIVGCVTHVFVSDPTKGFARNITSMLEN